LFDRSFASSYFYFLQPLDVGVFAPLKYALAKEFDHKAIQYDVALAPRRSNEGPKGSENWQKRGFGDQPIIGI
jgi:hypothetical protein